MMFSVPAEPYEIDEDVVRVPSTSCFILHADHEQNCSTSTVRLVGSSPKANLLPRSAGICALWGLPPHGGANSEVAVEMLGADPRDGGGVQKPSTSPRTPGLQAHGLHDLRLQELRTRARWR
jgi:citrate synthase